MYRNKYTALKRGLLRLQEIFPPARDIKRLFLPFKTSSYRKRLDRHRARVEAVRRETGHSPLFDHVEIETINRCNGECAFCPVNRHLDARPAARMTDELFTSILEQLRALDYTGEVCLFSNNESLLDRRMPEFTARTREALPRAKITLSTNGILLTPDLYRELVNNLDLFYVNNYCDDFKLTPANEELLRLAQSRDDWWAKTHIVIRYRREIMTSRGGQAPNRKGAAPKPLGAGCFYPASQLIIRPDGKLSLCCNDASGVHTMGNLTEQGLTEAWWSDSYEEARTRLLASREGFGLCSACDTMGD